METKNLDVKILIDLAKKKKNTLVIAAIILVSLLVAWKVYSGRKLEAVRLNRKITDITSEKKEKLALLNLCKEVQGEEESLNSINQKLLQEASRETLIQIVSKLAAENNLTVSSYNPLGVEEKDYFYTQGLSVSLTGQYEELKNFLQELSDVDPAIKLDSFSFNGPNAQEVTIRGYIKKEQDEEFSGSR